MKEHRVVCGNAVLLIMTFALQGCLAYHATQPGRLFGASGGRRSARRTALPSAVLTAPSPAAKTMPPRTDNIELSFTPAASEASEKEDAGTFDWWRQWYPVAIASDLGKKQPRQFTVLNEHFVVWWDEATQKFAAAKDACPHRLAPLSEGRISDDGKLHCTYHGWEFDGTGACTKIPQVEAKAQEAARKNKRACLQTVPCTEAHALIWIFPDSTREGWAASREVEPATVAEFDTVPELIKTKDNGLFFRVLNYNYDTLVENVGDPSHVPFAHHGIQGNRNRAGPIRMKVDNLTDAGFAVTSIQDLFGTNLTTRIHFRPPCLLYYQIDFSQLAGVLKKRPIIRLLSKIGLAPKITKPVKSGMLDGHKFYLVVYAVPSAPGQSYIITRFVASAGTRWRNVKSLMRWDDHLENMAVTDGDNMHVHYQERRLREHENGLEKFDRAYYMPAPADTAVRSFRRWLMNDGGGKPSWKGSTGQLGPLMTDRKKLFDRWESHTKYCPICRKAYAITRVLRSLTTVLSIGLGLDALTSVAAMAFLFPPGGLLSRFLMSCMGGAALWGVPLLVSGVCGYGAYRLHGLERRWVYTDYNHVERE
ncbi:unnamed protein product [Vitrella brassicaformis CCMP3155]|uniref:Rieske domain-containing protein n=1 Tax=Vitrella brassicaformis (strain CCMP3155) TaxID=1169540 RepID=A0A0G4FEV6_VITBC|nr:unnamed protein product [Vitrella brassicaformis CCMP3155]|eukprot:CEM11347.1 unnamed protein product [Vitrella brassicaformis CCMP3155]